MDFLDPLQVLCFHLKQTKKDPQRLCNKNRKSRQFAMDGSSGHQDINGLFVSLRLKDEDGEIFFFF